MNFENTQELPNETAQVFDNGLSATYSPEDNKLRLRSVTRLDTATYQRVKAAGFAWAPRQELFVAPAWSPQRADLLIDLCGEIGDEDSTLVDRAQERAERFSEYGANRASDAAAAQRAVASITENIPFGQPILVGHHSERRARKDAQRIEDGMRKAVQMWDTAQYWKQRAAGAIQHAKYKERPDVRARRIKGIEADKRKQERTIADAEKLLQAWQQDGLTLEKAKHLANFSYFSRCYPLADFPRDPPASQYEGQMSLWSALEGGVITAEQARETCLRNYAATIAWARRWIEHYDHRLTYERAMLQEQGGLAGERFALKVGGQVLAGGEWLTILRLNKVAGKVASVTTNARFVRVRSIEEITDYRAPSAELAEKVKAATKLPPLVNYAGAGFVHITQAQWDKIPKEYKGTERVKASNTAAAHRVRVAMGCYVLTGETDWSKRHSYPALFITDAKTVQPPVPTQSEAEPKAPAVPAPVREVPASQPVHQKEEPNHFDRMRSQLREGVKVVSAPQLFPTPADLAARMVELAGLCEGARVLEPSAGTGRLVHALRETGKAMHIVAVEVNCNLSEALRASFQNGRTEVPQEVEVITADFLALESIGTFDAIVMNPPFANAADIQHIQHALTLLEPGGCLVAICANGPRQRAQLLPLVEKHGGLWEDLPAGTFQEEGTNVQTALLVIQP